jgi:uncharacterized protein YdhG (YjbR/CyaY superfamily)
VETVDEHLRAAPEPQRTTLLALRATLRELLPHADEALSYGMPGFVVGGKPVAGDAWAKHTAATTPTRGQAGAPAVVGLSDHAPRREGTHGNALRDPC